LVFLLTEIGRYLLADLDRGLLLVGLLARLAAQLL
jgi:hypothetical protein